ncbi:MAG: hypothetical protein KAY37_12750 [Phycisphaerae bacterium]|nr:hypothetical protein [Phycisphaerae bacterium]
MLTSAAAARADIFHLRSGGTVNGQLLEIADEQYKIRTVVGIVHLPITSVERIEEAESPFAEYERRAREAADTPEEQTALAAWCEKQDLQAERRRHLRYAIELDPDYAPARQALGYERVDDTWVDSRHLRDRQHKTSSERGKRADHKAEKLAEATRRQWYLHIRAVKQTFLDSSRTDRMEEGRARIRRINDPLAIEPLTDLLGHGTIKDRELLVEMLSGFDEDAATMNLTILALLDSSNTIRRRVVVELVRRNDPRVETQFWKALHSDNNLILARAAYALGQLNSKAVVPDLIDLLRAQEMRWVEIPVRLYFQVMTNEFRINVRPRGNHSVSMPPTTINGKPIIGAWYWELANVWRYRHVTVYRTEVLEALRCITGQDFGFEREEWLNWYRDHIPSEGLQAESDRCDSFGDE